MLLNWHRFPRDNSILYGPIASRDRVNACELTFDIRLLRRAYLIVQSYQNAMATIRRVMTTDFHFQLVVTRVFEEGEELLLDEDDEST
jgi:VID27 N-terminal region